MEEPAGLEESLGPHVWHGADAATSLKNPEAHTQSAADVEAAGLEESLVPHVLQIGLAPDVTLNDPLGQSDVDGMQRPVDSSNMVPPPAAQSDATTGHSVLGISPGAVQQQRRE